MSEGNAVILDDFAVAAVEDSGIWIVDDDGNGWRVGTVEDRIPDDNKLARRYRDLFAE